MTTTTAKCDYVLAVYKADKRCKTGERFDSFIKLEPSTKNDAESLVLALSTWASKPGYRYEYASKIFDFPA